jgi:hypothetical protein
MCIIFFESHPENKRQHFISQYHCAYQGCDGLFESHKKFLLETTSMECDICLRINDIKVNPDNEPVRYYPPVEDFAIRYVPLKDWVRIERADEGQVGEEDGYEGDGEEESDRSDEKSLSDVDSVTSHWRKDDLDTAPEPESLAQHRLRFPSYYAEAEHKESSRPPSIHQVPYGDSLRSDSMHTLPRIPRPDTPRPASTPYVPYIPCEYTPRSASTTHVPPAPHGDTFRPSPPYKAPHIPRPDTPRPTPIHFFHHFPHDEMRPPSPRHEPIIPDDSLDTNKHRNLVQEQLAHLPNYIAQAPKHHFQPHYDMPQQHQFQMQYQHHELPLWAGEKCYGRNVPPRLWNVLWPDVNRPFQPGAFDHLRRQMGNDQPKS